MVKISRAVGCFCCHTVRIQQLGETTEQQKFLSPSCWVTCAVISCRSFLLSCSGSTVTYLEENWGFVSVLLKILRPSKSRRYPECKLWLWAAGKKTEEGRGNRDPCLFGLCIVALGWIDGYVLVALLPILPLDSCVSYSQPWCKTLKPCNAFKLMRVQWISSGYITQFPKGFSWHLRLVLHKEYLFLYSLNVAHHHFGAGLGMLSRLAC